MNSTTSEENDSTISIHDHSTTNGFLPKNPSIYPLLSPALLCRLRSHCKLKDCSCPHGKGLQFRSRISPSPSKKRLRSRRRRLSEQTRDFSIDESNRQDSVYGSQLSPEPILEESLQNSSTILQRSSTPISKESRNHKRIYKKSTIVSKSLKNNSEESFIEADKFFSSQKRELLSDYFSDSDTPTKLKESTRRLTFEKDLNEYIAYSSDEELDDWWNQPKTDYTYSCSLSYRECVTPERTIPSPNMSRRGVRTSHLPQHDSPPFHRRLRLRSRVVPIGKLSMYSDSEDEVEEYKQTEISSSSSAITKRLDFGLDGVSSNNIRTPYSVSRNGFSKRECQSSKTIKFSRWWRETLQSWKTSIVSSLLLILSIFSWIFKKTFYFVSIPYHYLRNYLRSHRLRRKNMFYTTGFDQNSSILHTSVSTTTTIVTTESFFSKSINHVRNGLVWYRTKRSKSPFLWAWLIPLLLLLIPLIAYWWQRDDGTQLEGSERWTPVVGSFSRMFRNAFIFIKDSVTVISSYLISSFLEGFYALCSSILFLLNLLMESSVFVFKRTCSFFGFIFSPFVSWYNDIKIPNIMSGTPSVVENLSSSSLNYFSTGLTLFISGAKNIINAGFESIYRTMCYIGSGALGSLLSVWELLGSLLFSMWYIIVSLFSSLWQVFTIGSPAVLAPTSPSPPENLMVVDEKFLSKLLEDPKMRNVISSTIQEQNFINKDNVEETIKLAIDKHVKSLEMNANLEIFQIKKKQTELLETLNKMSESLKETRSNEEINANIQSEIKDLSFRIETIAEQLSTLKVKQSETEEVRKTCCNKTLTVEEIEDRIRSFLLSIFNGNEETSLRLNIVSKLKNYFVDQEEFDKIGDISDQMKLFMNEEFLLEKISKIVNKTVTERTSALLRVTVSGSNNEFNAHLNEVINEQILHVAPKVIAEYFNENKDKISLDSKVSSLISEDKSLLLNTDAFNDAKLGVFDANPNLYIDETRVKEIVNEALLKYDADKTGLVDHALESGGGAIVSTKCTEGFSPYYAEWTILGYPVYRYSTNNPRSVIQPDRMPGQCWAFTGSEGFIVIQLAGPVKFTGFTLEHIPRSLSPLNSTDSAPKNFEVYGLEVPDKEGILIGSYTYDVNGYPFQYFEVENYDEYQYFPYVELRIKSNHGNLKYTCIYRFRVHGKRLK